MILSPRSIKGYNHVLSGLKFDVSTANQTIDKVMSLSNPNTRNKYLTAIVYKLKQLPEAPEGLLETVRELMKANEDKRIEYKNDNLRQVLPDIQLYFDAVNNPKLDPLQRFYVWLHVYFPHRYDYYFVNPIKSLVRPQKDEPLNLIKILSGGHLAEITLLTHKSLKQSGPIEITIDYNLNLIPTNLYFVSRGQYIKFVARAFRTAGITFSVTEYRHVFVSWLQNQDWYNDLTFEDKEKYHMMMLGHTFEVSQKWYRNLKPEGT